MNDIPAAPFPIHITPHHLTLSPALVEFAIEKMAKVPRFANDVLAAEIVLRRHHGTADGRLFSASARLALAGRDIHATAAHADLYTAIVKMVSRLSRRSRKRKTRLSRKPHMKHTRMRRRTARMPFAITPESLANEDVSLETDQRSPGARSRLPKKARTTPLVFTNGMRARGDHNSLKE